MQFNQYPLCCGLRTISLRKEETLLKHLFHYGDGRRSILSVEKGVDEKVKRFLRNSGFRVKFRTKEHLIYMEVDSEKRDKVGKIHYDKNTVNTSRLMSRPLIVWV